MNQYNKNKKVGCILIHGFGGDSKEVSPLTDYLNERGYTTICASLKGHTGKRSDLKKYTYQDWINSAHECYKKINSECDYIFIFGFSMGGLIALQLANKFAVDAIVTLNTPIFFWNFKNVYSYLVDDIKNKKLTNTRRYVRSCTNFPIRSLINFRLLLSYSKKILSNVNCSLFIVQSLNDDAVKEKSGDYIYNNVSSQVKNLKFYEDSGHLILWSNECNKVLRDIDLFINDII
ncbi:MAG: alpha/beta hydrolase [Eubacteriaceae bacterium]